MKLITKIYLGIGLILLTFSIVTLTYLYQAAKVESDMHRLLVSTEILRYSEAMQKSMIDKETGIRGYLITENEIFLQPYYMGMQQLYKNGDKLEKLLDDPRKIELFNKIKLYGIGWDKDFADPIIEAKKLSLKSHLFKAAFDTIYQTKIKGGAGKRKMDSIRAEFKEFDKYETKIKNQRLAELNQSLEYTRTISISLTVLAIIIGVATTIILVRNIRRRLSRMINLAEHISQGDFDVKVTDTDDDEMTRLANALNVMAGKLKAYFTNLTKMNKELDQFAYVVSHDLKAPLRAINNLAEWIDEDITNPEPEVKQNLKLMRGRVHRMENLINGILEYSKVGRKEIHPETFHVKKLLEEIVDSLAPDSRFKVTLPAWAPVLTTEKILLQQAFTNLISNGLKYNNKPEGKIEIKTREAGNFYEFTVTDNGPGIPKQFHDKIFGIFQTMEARDTLESTGIGLAIVKKIIEEKGGSIRIESNENEFTSFIFTWPKTN